MSCSSELQDPVSESAIAYRKGLRYVKRLVRCDAPDTATGGPVQLVIGSRGSIDTLAWRPVESPLALQPGEVRIRVKAAALNFKDVLNAMGTLAAAIGPLGFECSGIVDAVGAGVRDLAVGDPVLAIASGALSTRVVADERFVVPKPATWTYEDAAAFSIAFVTAAFALEQIGRLTAGDRVLVHSAAGGVGLAAVRVAHDAGAEVYATAGTEEKRHLLRELGVRHVFDSRSTAFVDGISAATEGQGVTVVLNALGGDAIPASLRVLASGGRFLEIGKKDAWSVERMAETRPDVAYSLIDWSETARDQPESIASLLRGVVARFGDAPMPLPVAIYGPSQAVEALRALGSGRTVGKVAIRVPGEAHPSAPIIREQATYLVTGGLSGLGFATARWLVDRGARHLVLIGRSAPSEEVAAELDSMRTAGADIEVASCDVADEERLRRVLERALERRPPLKGVVHAAGVLADAGLLQQDWQKFQQVFAPKVTGAWALDRLTRAAQLDFFTMYSSVASVFGTSGQANHSSANAFLDALAYQRQRDGLPALSVNWGVWSRIGAGERHGVADRAAKQGMGLIEPGSGLEALRIALGRPEPQLVIAPVGWARFAAQANGNVPRLFSELTGVAPRATVKPQTAVATNGLRTQVADAPITRRKRIVHDHVARAAGQVLGIAADRQLDEHRPFHELGLDSLMAVELRDVLAREIGESLPATLLFDYPTLSTLVGFLLNRLSSGEAAQPMAPQPAADTDGSGAGGDVVTEIEDMSDEDVDRLLAERVGRNV